jgi:hypothetical protein
MLGRIVPGRVAEVAPEEPVGGRHRATVKVVDPVIDAASGTFGLRLELPNTEHALPADAIVLAGSIVRAEPGEERPGRVRTALSGLRDPIHLAAGASVATGGLSLPASGLFSRHRDRGESRTDDGPGVGLG